MTGKPHDDSVASVNNLIQRMRDAGLEQRFAQQFQGLIEMREVIHKANEVAPPADPRWEWVEVPRPGGPSEWVKCACRHLTPTPVESVVTGEVVARLCPDCDAQLPA